MSQTSFSQLPPSLQRRAWAAHRAAHRQELLARPDHPRCDYQGCQNPAEFRQVMNQAGGWNHCCGDHLETGMARPL